MTNKIFNQIFFNPATKSDEPFRSDLTVNSTIDPAQAGGNQTVTPINPQYCATDSCASALASLLSDIGTVEIFSTPPFPGWPQANEYVQSGNVPWLRIFANGHQMEYNAGQLAVFFTHGFNPDLAGQLLHASVQQDFTALQNA